MNKLDIKKISLKSTTNFLKPIKVISKPDLRFLIYFSIFAFILLNIFGSFGLFQTTFLTRTLLSFCYVIANFFVFGLALLVFNGLSKWNSMHWLLWLATSLLLSSVLNLLLHDLFFGEAPFNGFRLLTMAYYIFLVFALSWVTYQLVFKSRKIVDKYPIKSKTLKIPADNPKNDFLLKDDAFLFAKSAGNYIEVNYIVLNKVKKKLVRSTIKSVLKSVKNHEHLMQCHQSFIVNLSRVKQVKGNTQKRILILDVDSENIPVSRRFSTTIKEAFNQRSLNVAEYP